MYIEKWSKNSMTILDNRFNDDMEPACLAIVSVDVRNIRNKVNVEINIYPDTKDDQYDQVCVLCLEFITNRLKEHNNVR